MIRDRGRSRSGVGREDLKQDSNPADWERMNGPIIFADLPSGSYWSSAESRGRVDEQHIRCEFQPSDDGRCYAAIRSTHEERRPFIPNNGTGWFIGFFVQAVGSTERYPIGWYENAQISDSFFSRPSGSRCSGGDRVNCSAAAEDVYYIPAEAQPSFGHQKGKHFTLGYVVAYPEDTTGEAQMRRLRIRKFSAEMLANRYRTAQIGPHGVVDAALATVETELINRSDFDPKTDEDARKLVYASIVARRGQSRFRNAVLKAYSFRCAVTDCSCVEVLEAAHVKAYKGDHTDHIQNGLLLRSDVHTLFDLRKLGIDPVTMTIVVAPSLRSGEYGHLHGKTVRVPNRIEEGPSAEALAIHLNEVCGNKPLT